MVRGINCTCFIFFSVKPEDRFPTDRVDEVIQLWDYVKKLTRSIEIKYQSEDSKILTRVYFPFDPAVCLNIFISP